MMWRMRTRLGRQVPRVGCITTFGTTLLRILVFLVAVLKAEMVSSFATASFPSRTTKLNFRGSTDTTSTSSMHTYFHSAYHRHQIPGKAAVSSLLLPSRDYYSNSIQQNLQRPKLQLQLRIQQQQLHEEYRRPSRKSLLFQSKALPADSTDTTTTSTTTNTNNIFASKKKKIDRNSSSSSSKRQKSKHKHQLLYDKFTSNTIYGGSNETSSMAKDANGKHRQKKQQPKEKHWFVSRCIRYLPVPSVWYKKQPRGTNQVKLREAVELGGIPRGDRYSSKDWFYNTITLPNSGILKSIRNPVVSVTSWATFLSLLHYKQQQQSALTAAATAAASSSASSWISSRILSKNMYTISTTAPHSLMMSALGLLLVFRTNAAYQRFAEGRVIWERIVNTARDFSRMLMLYEKQIGLDKRRRIQRLLVAFPYLLRHRIRPNLVMRRYDDEAFVRDPNNSILLYQDTGIKDNDPEAAYLAQTEEETGKSRRRKKRPLYYVDKRTLPWRLLPGRDALERCASAQNRPLWVCDRMAAEIRNVPDSAEFTNRERLALLSHVDALSRCIGGAERIHQTMVPLNYARHTLRALTVWLFSLPFAMIEELRLLTGPVLFLVSWLLFGVYEIGYAIEDPFQGTLRLSILCDTIRRDVLGDETIRCSAFKLDADNDDDEDDDESESSSSTAKKPPQSSSLLQQQLNTNYYGIGKYRFSFKSPDAYQ